MSDEQTTRENEFLQTPPLLRRVRASRLAKTVGRTFKIRKPDRITFSDSSFYSERQTPNSDLNSSLYVSSLPDDEVRRLYASVLEDLIEKDNLKEELQRKSVDEMRTFLRLYRRRDTASHVVAPSRLIARLDSEISTGRAKSVLDELLISLKNEGLSWIRQLEDADLLKLFKLFVRLAERLQVSTDPSESKKVTTTPTICSCVRVVHAIANTGYGFNKLCAQTELLSLAIFFICLALNEITKLDKESKECSDDLRRTQRTALDILTVFIHQNANVVLINMQAVARRKNASRFQFIVDGFKHADEDLKRRYLTFVNSLFTCKGYELYYRMHVRSELSNVGFFKLVTKLSESDSSDAIQAAVNQLQHRVEEDYISLNEKYNSISLNFDDPFGLFKYLHASVENTAAEKHLMSIIHHLLLIRDDVSMRNAYYKMFDAFISRVIMSKSLADCEFDDLTSFSVDFDEINDIIQKSSIASTGSVCTMDDLRSLNSQNRVSDDCTSVCTTEGLIEDVNFDGASCRSAAMSDKVDEVPPAEIAPPPPPPPPLPPILPKNLHVQSKLPSYLHPKSKYTVNVPLKRVTWDKINAMNIKKNALWASTSEDKYANESFCNGLVAEFSVKCAKVNTNGKPAATHEDEKMFYFLDAKTGQNLAILISFLKVGPEVIAKWILDCDDSNLSLNALEQIQRCLPHDSAFSTVRAKSGRCSELQDPERLIVMLCDVPMVSNRIRCMTFRKKCPELLEETKSSLQACTKACRKIRKSTEFKTIMEVLLTAGNFLNCSIKNYECAYGFNYGFLPKVISTRAANSDRTLLHFIIETVNRHDDSAIDFLLSLHALCEDVARVDSKVLAKNLEEIRSGLTCVENAMSKVKSTDSTFCYAMQEFLASAKSNFEMAQELYESMKKEYQLLGEYLTFDTNSHQINEFFSCLNEFIGHVKQCKCEIEALKRAEERRIMNEKYRLISEQRKVNLHRKEVYRLKPGDEDENVMDRLLAALSEPDACFSRPTRFKTQNKVQVKASG